jgi:hypothetical protein
MAMKQRVVDHIVEHLAAIGVDYIFGVDGANIEDLYDAAFFQSDITAVLAKHEFSAATMADGHSRSGGGLGVVAANSGVSALNLLPGLGESFTSRVPVLALVGQPETTMDGRGSLQDTSGRNGSLNAEDACRPPPTSPPHCQPPWRRREQAGLRCCCYPRTFNSLTCGSTVAWVSTDLARRCARRLTSMARQSSASNAQPTKSRPSPRFLGRR